MAKTISQQIEEYKNTITENRQEAEAIRREAKANNSWKTNNSSQTVAERQKQNLQHKREIWAEPKPKTTAQKRDAAQKLYDDYLKSDEYKRNQVAAMKAQTDEWMQASMFGSEAYTPGDHRDKKELQLKAMVDHYTELARKEEEGALMEADLQEVEGMEEQDRAALETYIISRNQEFANRMNPMVDGGFGLPDPASAALVEKYGQKRVDELAESLERSRNAEMAEAAAQAGREGVNKGTGSAVGHNIASVGANAVGGLTGLFGYLQELGQRTGRYQTMDENNIGTLLGAYAGGVRSQTAENIAGDVYDENGNLVQDGGKLRQAGAYLYQGGMSAVDSLARAALGGGAAGGAALAATGSFTQAMQEASARGATPGEAAVMATVTAGIEYLSEKTPLDKLVKAAKAGGHGLKETVKNALLQAGVEATTEEVSLIATALMEAVILREQSGYQQRVNELIASGLRPDAAEATAFAELMEEAKETAIVSALSGGISEAGAAAVGNVVNRGTGKTQEVQVEKAAEPQFEQGVSETAAQNNVAAPTDTNAVSNPIESYAPEKQNMIRSFIQSVDQNIKGLVQRVKSGDTTFERKKLADVSDRAAKDIGSILGTDVSGYTHNINTNGIQHILKRHGENGKHDHSMSLDDDIARVGWVLNNYDSVDLLKKNGKQVFSTEFLDKDGNPAPQIVFVKKIDGSYYVAETVFDNKFKKLWVQSVRLQKNNGDVTQTPAEDLSANHETNARSDFASPSPDLSVSETAGNVNGNVDESGAQGADTQELSAAGEQPGIKGTGAAEQNFTGKADYQQLLYEGNVQSDRAGDVRPVELPKTDIKGGDISATTGNVYGSQNTSDNLASAMKEPTSRGDFSYIKIINDQATQRARKTVESSGSWEEARLNFRSEVDRGNAGAEISARGALILNHYGEVYEQVKASGDEAAAKKVKQEWLSVLSDIQKLGTNTAQGLQAMRIIRNLMPQDKLEFAKSAVRNMVRDFQQGVLDKRKIFKSDNKVLNAVMMPMEVYRKVTNWAMNNDRFGDEAFGKAAFTRAMAGYLQANGVKPGTDLGKVDNTLIEKAMTHFYCKSDAPYVYASGYERQPVKHQVL